MKEELKTVSEQLGTLIDGSNSKAISSFQTGKDESFLIGTESGLIAFAKSIIDSVINAKKEKFFGEEARTSNLIYDALNSKGETTYDWIAITDSEEIKDNIFYKLND